MKKWWHRKKQSTRRRKKDNDRHTFIDFLADVLFWIPEVIIFPFRVLVFLIRGLGRWIGDLFDIV
ncbi:hypothetical protein SAMN05216389_1158 [Oceanobacillus limi]|uniref:Uncharacterized protein n=1 Tax=Oceanobacillus limi TaxID=930131 RepID=A0A1I0FF56_9BACI|nr:hypothetical protein [Oceanobacillus limi]SET56596.1 hypothetical protein SAMN05216389_1158 [Oceanobacillus limi]